MLTDPAVIFRPGKELSSGDGYTRLRNARTADPEMEPASCSPLALFDRELGAVLYTFFKMLRLHASVTRITEDPGPK